MRLHKHAVALLLKSGRVLRSSAHKENAETRGALITTRFLCRERSDTRSRMSSDFARIAISVPKRILGSSVSRNTFKRWVKETFRKHELRLHPVDLLVSLKQKIDVKQGYTGAETLKELQSAFGHIVQYLDQSSRSAR